MPPRKPLSSRAQAPRSNPDATQKSQSPFPPEEPLEGSPADEGEDSSALDELEDAEGFEPPDDVSDEAFEDEDFDDEDFDAPEDDDQDDDAPALGDDEVAGTMHLDDDEDRVEPTDDPDLDGAPGAAIPPRSRTATRIAAMEAVEEEHEALADTTRAGRPVKLELTAGPDAGQSHKFNGVRMVVGRVVGCDIRLTDQSVSRRHLELVGSEAGVLLRDLGSGNGTKVNGERVTERLLEHGDEVALGKTRFRVIDELTALKEAVQQPVMPPDEVGDEEAAEEASSTESSDVGEPSEPSRGPPSSGSVAQAPAGPPELPIPSVIQERPRTHVWFARFRALPPKQRIVVAGALVLVVAAFVALARFGPWAPNPARIEAQTMLVEAKAALEQKSYAEAMRLAEQAERQFPGIDLEGVRKRARELLAAQKAFESVRALAASGQLDQARDELAQLHLARLGTDEDRAALAAELDTRQREQLRAQVRAALAEGDLEGAASLSAALPQAEQDQLRADFDQARVALERQRREEEARLKDSQKSQRQRARAQKQVQVDALFAGVARKFHAGEYERAAVECDRVADEHRGNEEVRLRAKELKVLIPGFGRNFEDGHRKFRAGQLVSAAKPLKRAKELYEQIGFPGALGSQIDEELLASSIAAGKEALHRDELAVAAGHFRQAAALDAKDARTSEGLERLRERAEKAMEDATAVASSNPRAAMQKLKAVLAAVAPGTPLYRRARAQLDALEKANP